MFRSVASSDHLNPPFLDSYSNTITGPILGGQVIPPLSVQQKIAKEVDSRRAKAKTLNKEAREVIIKTKQKVEKMILGR
ncbi:hypothetical protein CEE34_06790 [Candidatus Aerophobetes bacterium Ae_b3a]|nr:MAG: hypothetical protein CEE34_06790 [Candidatus Aerophobetes bacterium Ae_b3a]